MNIEALTDFLRDGALIRILTKGQERPIQVWVEEFSSSFFIHYSHRETVGCHVTGGEIVPTLSIQNKTIRPEKAELVTEFLIKSFGLSRRQADVVVSGAT